MISIRKTSLTEGPIYKKLLLFSLPIFLSNLCQQLYNTADAMIVGHFLDENALAAVNSSGTLIFMLVSFFFGISMGAGVVISRYYGAGDTKNMRLAIHTDIAFGLVAGVALTVFGVVFTPQILRRMGTPEDVLPNSILYFRIYFLGALGNLMYNITSGILRAVGDSRRPLYYLIISTLINILLDLLFVGVLGLGIGSAALATILSQLVSAILCSCRLLRCKEIYRVNIREVRFDLPMLGQIIRLGVPSGVQNSVIAIANVFVQSNINSFDKFAMAGCGSYAKVEGFAFLPITCFAMGLTTFVSQNLGAGKYDRVKKATKFGIFLSMILAEAIGIIFYIFAPQLIGLFSDNSEVIAFGVAQARVAPPFYFLLSFSHCIAGIMRGAGKASVPMYTMLICWCLIRVTYISVTLYFVHDISVIFWAYPLTWTLSSVFFLFYFLKADWIHGFEKKKYANQ